MEAACAASAIVGLVFNCATAIKTCHDLGGKYKNADQTLRSIATESATLRSALLQLQHLMMRDPVELSYRWDFDSMLPQTFEMAIDSFQAILTVLIRHLDEFSVEKRPASSSSSTVLGKLSRTMRIKLLWDEAAMQDILVQLRAQQQSLQFLLTILQIGTIAEIRKRIQKNGNILQDLANSAKELRYDASASMKRKHKIEVEMTTNTDSDVERSNDGEDDCREPSAKRRSLSPEDDSTPLGGRTRSGRIYQPELATAELSASNFTLPISTRAKSTKRHSSSTTTKKTANLPFLSSQHEATYFLRPRPRESTPDKMPSSPKTNLSSIHEHDDMTSYFTPPSSSKSSQSRRAQSNHTRKTSFDSISRSSRRSRERSTTPTTPGSLYSIPNTPISISKTSFPTKESPNKVPSISDLSIGKVDSMGNNDKRNDERKGSTSQESKDKNREFNSSKITRVEDFPDSSDGSSSPIHAEAKDSSSTLESSGQETEDHSHDEGLTSKVDNTSQKGSSSRNANSIPVSRATEADAQRYRIPAGYSLKNWDPREEPILLLGSVFDANSLGKWIYDWTVFHHGPSTPISDSASELWLLLITLTGKLKRSEEVMPRIRSASNREMVEDFIEAGERLLERLRKLLKMCEKPLLKLSKKDGHEKETRNIGTGFVDLLFGADQKLDQTEKLLASIRLWDLRFDANCNAVLSRPHRDG